MRFEKRCSRAVSAAVAAAALIGGCSTEPPPLNVVVITLDTTRADRLGAYGNDDIETPNIDGLARDGRLYERCYTPVPITLPSHLSIFTGTYPTFHGVRENGGFYVAPELDTMAEILGREGYDTAAFIGAFPLDSQTGLDQGFDLYDDNYPSSLEEGKHPALRGFFDERPAADVVRPALEWLDRQAAERPERPFFLWTHFFDPHQPQIPPSPYRERYAHNLYDGEIASVDEALGSLFQRLDHLELRDRTLVVLTADHGEGLGDHGELTHALLLYSQTIRVPLIIRAPNGPQGERITTPVATVDILPTVLETLGLEVPATIQGHRLPAREGEATARRKILSETLYGALLQGWSPLERLTAENWVLIHGPTDKLFDVAADPGELEDLADREPAQLETMRRVLFDRKNELSIGGVNAREESISPAKQARLEALGYLGGTSVDLAELEISQDLADPHQAIAVFREMNEGKQLIDRDPGMAAAVLEHAAGQDPGNTFILQYLAQAYSKLNDPIKWQKSLDRLLANSPENLAGHLMLSQLLEHQGESSRALDALARAVELDPKNLATRLLYAHRLEDLGRDGDARLAYQEVLAGDADHNLGRNGYATLLYRNGEIEAAIESFERVLRAQPFYPPAHLNLAVVDYDRQNLDAAERGARRALALRPTYGAAHRLLAVVFETRGDTEQAIQSWHNAKVFAASAEARQVADEALAALQ